MELISFVHFTQLPRNRAFIYDITAKMPIPGAALEINRISLREVWQSVKAKYCCYLLGKDESSGIMTVLIFSEKNVENS